MGIYAHPPDALLISAGFHAHEVSPTLINQFGHFVSAYAAKAALWLRYLGE